MSFTYWHPQRRFGMFIHWGPYALSGWHEQYQMRHDIPRQAYAEMAMTFNPTAYDPDAWVKLAKQAGMRYLCFTAKHHDGFCMWDTKQTDYSIMHTPYGRDALKLLADACAREDMGLCLYYSIPDWHHPSAHNPLSTHQVPPEAGDVPDMAAYRQYIRAQMGELLTGYGNILALFWDIPPQIDDPSMNDYVRSLQPGIMINDRGFGPGDYATPERHVPAGEQFRRPTEACQSVGQESWGWRTNEDYYSNLTLMSEMDRILSMGGNYLLNVGPDALGRIPPEPAAIVAAIGHWYGRIAESYEGTRPLPAFGNMPDIRITARTDTLYLHLPPAPRASGLVLQPLTELPHTATMLNTGEAVRCSLDRMPSLYAQPEGKRPYLHLSGLPVNALCGEIIVLKLSFPEGSLAPLDAQLDSAVQS